MGGEHKISRKFNNFINLTHRTMFTKSDGTAAGRPIIISCNKLPGTGYLVLENSSASTLDELKRDIVANSGLSLTDLGQFKFSTATHGDLTHEVPLFETNAGVNDPNSPEVDNIKNYFFSGTEEAINDERILCVNLTESAKLFNSGVDTIESCCNWIIEHKCVDDFVAKTGAQPEAAGLRQLRQYICNKQIELSRPQIRKMSSEEAMQNLTNSINGLVMNNNMANTQMQTLIQENAYLKSEISRLKRELDEDDEDEDGCDGLQYRQSYQPNINTGRTFNGIHR